MLQRIQSLYFVGVFALCVWCMCCYVGRYVMPDGEVFLWSNASYWPLMALLVIVAVLQIPSLLLYKHRLLQIRISIFSGMLLIGWYVLFFWHGFFTHSVLDSDANYIADCHFSPQWTAAFPAVAAILIVAAVRAVMHDELLVRSLDRLR